MPVGSEEAYESPYPWYKFKYIVGIDFNDKEVTVGGLKYILKTSDFGERYCSVIGHDDEYGKLGDLNMQEIKYEGHSYPVTRIEDSAFENCKGLTSVVIPNTVTYVGKRAFGWCNDLKSAVFPNSITSLAESTFEGCTSLASFTIPAYVKNIGYHMFSDCTSLKSITIPASVKRIEIGAFLGCKGLTSVVIPNSVTYVGNGAFADCDNLKSATFPNSITSLYSTFDGCSSLANFTIPDSVKDIGPYTFYGCTSLKNITIPASVEQFGYYWFAECYNLEELTCLNTIPPIAGNYGSPAGDPYYFEDVTYSNATLYVPKESVEAYKTANIWSNFKKIVGRDFSGISAVQTVGFSVSIDGGKLNIAGAKDKAVSVYTIGGAKVYDNNHYTGEDISVARGTYIVKAGAKSLVVTVK